MPKLRLEVRIEQEFYKISFAATICLFENNRQKLLNFENYFAIADKQKSLYFKFSNTIKVIRVLLKVLSTSVKYFCLRLDPVGQCQTGQMFFLHQHRTWESCLILTCWWQMMSGSGHQTLVFKLKKTSFLKYCKQNRRKLD